MLNSDMTLYLSSHRRKLVAHDFYSIYTRGVALRRARNTKPLGVIVDEKLRLGSHAFFCDEFIKLNICITQSDILYVSQ